MIVGALAVYHDEPNSLPERLLRLAVQNTLENCAQSVESDGTWTETPDYWYFGTQAHAQLSSALLSATGSTHGMLTANTAFQDTGIFHIYNYGMTQKFNYGDCGPPKITATANSLLFYANELNRPLYTLYQRDRPDAADPLAMLWYNPHVAGTWYHELPLDREFPDPRGAWVSARSSWTDPLGLFVAMKAGQMVGHATRQCDLLLSSLLLVRWGNHLTIRFRWQPGRWRLCPRRRGRALGGRALPRELQCPWIFLRRTSKQHAVVLLSMSYRGAKHDCVRRAKSGGGCCLEDTFRSNCQRSGCILGR